MAQPRFKIKISTQDQPGLVMVREANKNKERLHIQASISNQAGHHRLYVRNNPAYFQLYGTQSGVTGIEKLVKPVVSPLGG